MFARIIRRLFQRWFPAEIANNVILIEGDCAVAIRVEPNSRPLLVEHNLIVDNDADFVDIVKRLHKRGLEKFVEGWEKGFADAKL